MKRAPTGHDRDCKCFECRLFRASYIAEGRRGEHRYVDPSPVVAHVSRLRADGMSVPAVAARAGVAIDTVKKVGQRRGLQQATAEALLAVRVIPSKDTTLIPAAPTLALIDKARAKKHTLLEIAQAAGLKAPNRLPTKKNRRVRSSTALAIELACRSLGVTKAAHEGRRAGAGMKETIS